MIVFSDVPRGDGVTEPLWNRLRLGLAGLKGVSADSSWDVLAPRPNPQRCCSPPN